MYLSLSPAINDRAHRPSPRAGLTAKAYPATAMPPDKYQNGN